MPRPDPPSALGNPVPPFHATVEMPAALTRRAGTVIAVSADGRPARPFDAGTVRSILVVKLDFIGDWVLATPFLADLRRHFPEAAITAVVLDRVFDLAVACRFVDRVVAVPAANEGPVRFAAASPADLDGFLADYRSGAFDLALVARWDTDFNGALRIADGSGARFVAGFSEASTPRRAVDNRGDDRFCSAVLLDHREGHEIVRDLALVAALGGAVRPPVLDLDLLHGDREAADAFLSAAFPGSGRPLLAVAPFAAPRKEYPPEKTAALVRRLRDAFPLDVAVVASPAHAARAEAFAAAIGDGAASAAGRLGLRGGAALIGRADALLWMDSSPGHMAAALGTPAAILFANAVAGSPRHVGSPDRFRPWAPDGLVHILRPAMPVAPCSDGCDADEPHCIAAIDADAAFPALAAFVGRAVAVPVAAAASPGRSRKRR